MLSVAVIVCVSDCVVDQPLLLLSCLIYLCRVFIYSYLIKFPYQRNIQISKHFRNWYSSCFLVWNRLYSWWFHDDKPTPVCVCECLMSNCCEVCRLRAVICPCSAEIVPTCEVMSLYILCTVYRNFCTESFIFIDKAIYLSPKILLYS